MQTIGFLPLYLQLYKNCAPQYTPVATAFAKAMAEKLTQCGFNVVEAPVCCLKEEFAAAVKRFEAAGCSAIATLHLAYSPSLEAIDAIAATDLPVVVLDTTPDSFEAVDESVLMGNHGIHGVQDFCNLLLRRHKRFLLTAGPWQDPTFFAEATRLLKAAGMAWKITHSRVGAVGGEFKGMGDFQVPKGTFGMEIVSYTPQPEPTAEQMKAEEELDRERFIWDEALPVEIYRNTLRECLKLRSWLEQEKLDAFTVCFCGIERKAGWETLPFLECSKAISNGIGYAGEGDTFTAAMTRCLAEVFPKTSFTEMFCPDWKGNRLFTSHMGEMNLALSPSKPFLSEYRYGLSDVSHPAVAYGNFPAGSAILTDLAPGPDGTFTLITAPVHYQMPVTACTKRNCGWFVPASGCIRQFLADYSRAGGTHHLAASYEADSAILRGWAHLMGWNFLEIK